MSARDAALASGAPRVGIFFRLGLPQPARLWLGVGDCRAGIDATDGAGAVYSGLGEILNVPAFQTLINGTADRIEFKLSGVTASMLAVASGEAGDVKGVPLLIGIGLFGGDWQLLEAPVWLKRLIVDYLTVEMDAGPEGVVHTLGLSARTIFTGRRRPVLAYFTDEEQQRRSPGDLFCQHVARYSQDVTKVWPRF